MSIDFTKKHIERIDLAKKEISNAGLSNQKAQVVVALDISGSMGGMLSNGTIQDAFDRILPLGLQFDDDGKIDVWLFHDRSFNHQTAFMLKNRENFVQKEILSKYELARISHKVIFYRKKI